MLSTNNQNGPIILVSKDILYTFPFGYAYLAAYLKQHDEKIEVMFRPRKKAGLKRFVKEIMDKKPFLVGFGTLYPDLYEVKEIIKMLDEERREFPIVIGGQMVTPTPEFALNITGADIGVVGEGEIILHNLVKAIRENKDLKETPGLVIKEGERIINTGPGEFIKDMSLLPPIPYEMFSEEKWLNIGRFYINYSQAHWRYNDKVIAIHGGRG